ncbi:MAG TPA: phosphatase PAP2 family protein [Propionibacteriaceae bacterium]|nr:phosphatase PAP2 family protein [Propionibacteriaceae bacterium]
MTEPEHAAKPAVPPEMRSVIVVLAVLSGLVVVGLGLLHQGSRGPDAFDRAVSAAVRGIWPEAGAAAYLVDGLAAPVSALIVVAVLVVGCLAARQWRLTTVAAIGPLSAAASTIVLKPVVDRTIHGDNLAFPSGHTAFATAVGLVLGLLWIGLFRLRPAAGWAVLVSLTLGVGLVMALNQIILDAHYPSDIVGGFFTATAVVLITALLIDSFAEHLAHRGRHAEARQG